MSRPNVVATVARADEISKLKGEVMLGYVRPKNHPALSELLKHFEDGADVQVSKILANQDPKISGADVQSPKILANQDPKISGKTMMEEGGMARNGASVELTEQELDAQKIQEVKEMEAKVNGWITTKLSLDVVFSRLQVKKRRGRRSHGFEPSRFGPFHRSFQRGPRNCGNSVASVGKRI